MKELGQIHTTKESLRHSKEFSIALNDQKKMIGTALMTSETKIKVVGEELQVWDDEKTFYIIGRDLNQKYFKIIDREEYAVKTK